MYKVEPPEYKTLFDFKLNKPNIWGYIRREYADRPVEMAEDLVVALSLNGYKGKVAYFMFPLGGDIKIFSQLDKQYHYTHEHAVVLFGRYMIDPLYSNKVIDVYEYTRYLQDLNDHMLIVPPDM